MRQRIVCMAAALTLAAVPAILAPNIASGQQTIVMNHGILSNGSTWNEGANRLRQRFGNSVQIWQPSRDWTGTLRPQVTDLLANLHAIGVSSSSPIVVGHSLGGVVSRGLVRSMDADAIITVGAPNSGHPVVDNIGRIDDKIYLVGAALVPIAYASNCYDADMDFYDCLVLRRFAERIVQFAGILAAPQFCVTVTSNFIGDLDPDGPVIDTLNSMVSNERVSDRHNIVVTADWTARSMGPIPLLYQDPLEAWAVFDQLVMASFYMLEYGMYFLGSHPVVGAALITAGWEVGNIGGTWSDAIGGSEHDGFIPTSAQHYPGATPHSLYGPTHVEETRNPFVSQVVGDIAKRYGAIEVSPPTPDPYPDPPPDPDPCQPPECYATLRVPAKQGTPDSLRRPPRGAAVTRGRALAAPRGEGRP